MVVGDDDSFSLPTTLSIARIMAKLTKKSQIQCLRTAPQCVEEQIYHHTRATTRIIVSPACLPAYLPLFNAVPRKFLS